jgi:hypothetical protein
VSTVKVEAVFEARIKVDVDTESDNEAVSSSDVMQAVVDALGYTGIEIDDVTEWTQL